MKWFLGAEVQCNDLKQKSTLIPLVNTSHKGQCLYVQVALKRGFFPCVFHFKIWDINSGGTNLPLQFRDFWIGSIFGHSYVELV